MTAGQAAEAFSYTLTLGGRYAGTQDWVIRQDRGNTVARVQTEFGGVLPAGRKVQESRMQAGSGFSLAYAEADGGNRKPQFETIFDERSGLVTLRQGKDEASLPLIEGHHDPLSMLLWLRGLSTGEPNQSLNLDLRMVGGRVHLQSLPGSSVQGVAARVYFLRPGGAYVYVEHAAPHRLLRLIQPSDFGPVEALLGAPRASEGHSGGRPTAQRDQARPGRGQVGKPRRRK